MASKEYTFKGTAQWAKVFEEIRDMTEWNDDTKAFDKPSSTDGVYSIEVTLDAEAYKALKRTGSLAAKHSKENEAGEDVVRFKRPHKKVGKGGKVLTFASGAPKVVDATGSPWNFVEDGEIGNGSEVEVTVTVYETSFSPGTRLDKVKVINHVPRLTEEEFYAKIEAEKEDKGEAYV